MFIPCSGSELHHVPFVEHWWVCGTQNCALLICCFNNSVSLFYAIPRKLSQQKHTMFLFGGIFIAWYDTLQNKACHVLHASVHYIFYTWFWYLFAHFTTSLRSWSWDMVHFIKSDVLWKFSFFIRSISGFLLF